MECERTLVDSGVVVSESVLLKRERNNKYGSVEGLPDEELADPAELPYLLLRARLSNTKKRCQIRNFHRTRPLFKAFGEFLLANALAIIYGLTKTHKCGLAHGKIRHSSPSSGT